MNLPKFVLTVDQGTTSSRAMIVDRKGKVVSVAQKPFEQHFPKPGWVEHDPNEIWYTQSSVITEAMAKVDITSENLACIGITNQRETTIVWDRETGQPLYNAIVWQDRRTANYCIDLKAKGYSEMIRKKTGLIVDAYFSATKVKWILDNVAGARERAKEGKLCFGTVDTWLVWKLTKGAAHVTDVSNASRTMLFNIHTLQWDNELLELFNIPANILPEVKGSSEVYCKTNTSKFTQQVPISGIAGDQQAALFGQLCTTPGMIKTTYGTGCFMVMNTGDTPVMSKSNLLTTIAWKIGEKPVYALEGSVFVGGAIVQWLRDGINILPSSGASEQLATSVPDNGGVYFVPALTGLGAPYWDQYARGTIVGITRGTTSAHLTRAALEGIAYQVNDVLTAMINDMGEAVSEMRVDGGASANDFLMQFQSDVCRCPVLRPRNQETTAFGAAYLAGLAVGYWKDIDEIRQQWSVDRVFKNTMSAGESKKILRQWHEAVKCTQYWSQNGVAEG